MRAKINTVLPDGHAQMPPIIDTFSDGLLENDCKYKLSDLVVDELFNDEGYLMPVGTVVTIEILED